MVCQPVKTLSAITSSMGPMPPPTRARISSATAESTASVMAATPPRYHAAGPRWMSTDSAQPAAKQTNSTSPRTGISGSSLLMVRSRAKPALSAHRPCIRRTLPLSRL